MHIIGVGCIAGHILTTLLHLVLCLIKEVQTKTPKMQMPQRAENYYYYSNYPNYQHEYSTCTMDYNKMETEALIKGLFYVYFVKQFLGQTGKGLVLNSL